MGTAALLALAACSGDSGNDSTDGGSAAAAATSRSSPGGQPVPRRPPGRSRRGLRRAEPRLHLRERRSGRWRRSAAKDLLQTRLQANDPPDTFQAHAGKELTDYIDAAQLEDISDLYDEFGVTDVFPSDLIDLLTVDGKIYSMPSNIHRSNMVWANPAVLTEAGLDPAATYETMDDWFVALDAVEATGKTRSRSPRRGPRSTCSRRSSWPTSAPRPTTACGTARPTGRAPRSPRRSRTSRSS
ncbi:extracellular solute-binding protein [Oerskovia sp. M15]